ncbi:MAG: YjjW family glycine radical enzyme activase [Oscillospiraceae bacterium]|nr:YjjW family glycine radical enzyme activase [Oscillospiraceae bacterium]
MPVPVARIIPFSGVDGPGNRVAVFLQGCNQNCLYCHNPETINLCKNCGACVSHCPTGALQLQNGKVQYDISLCCQCDSCLAVCPNSSNPKTRLLTAEQVFAEIQSALPFTRGITVSGGECTLYPEFITELSHLAHSQGKTLFIDTNGQLPLRDYPDMVAAIDSAMIDLKACSAEEFGAVVGCPAQAVEDNIAYMASLGKLYEIRTVLCPDIMDIQKTVQLGAKLIAPYPTVRYKLIRYRSNGVRPAYLGLRQPTDEEMQAAAAQVRALGISNVVTV